MGLESATYIDDLNVNNPDGASDAKSQGDNHIRMIKAAVKATFPGLAGKAWRAQAKSGNYTALATDNMTLLVFSAAATLALTAAATLGNGWMAVVFAEGGDVVIDPNSSETVNSASTVTVNQGKAAIILVDGSEAYAFELAQPGGNVPIGSITDYAGTSAPTGWLLCYGQAVSRTTYASLFAAIGTTFGVGDGSTTFNLPDCRGRVTAGKDDMGGSSANRLTNQSGGLDGDTLGATGGAETHTLSEAQIPGHTHTFSGTTSGQSADHTHGYNSAAATTKANGGDSAAQVSATSTGGTSNDHTHTYSGTTSSTGSGSAHNNVQPTIVFNKIIKY